MTGDVAERATEHPATAAPRTGRVFYGWRIVAASTLVSTLQSAVFNLGAATLFLPVAREFETSRTVVAGAFAASRLEGGITGPIEGFLIHWVGPRRYMMVGWAIFGLGLIGIGLAQSIPQFYAAFLTVTLGQSVAGFLPIVTVLVNWFHRWRGRAIAMYQLGNSFGALLVPGVAWLVLNVGWRPSIIVLGVVVILIGVPLASTMRARPEDLGLLPDGVEPGAEAPRSAARPEDEPAPTPASSKAEPTIGQALRERSFWLLGTAHSTALLAWGALRVHEIPALVDIGLSEQTAATVFSVSLIVAAAGRLIGGFLGDVIGTRKVLAAAFLAQSGSVLILCFATTIVHALVFAVVFGVAFGARGTLMTVLRGEVFGRTNFSRLAGLMDPISTVGVVISPIFAARVYDVEGSYRFAFLVIAALSATAAVLVLGIRIPKRS